LCKPLAPGKLSLAGFLSSALRRKFTNNALRLLELLRVVPRGVPDVAILLGQAAIALVPAAAPLSLRRCILSTRASRPN
jgi:Sterol methyltransferase C-terminal